MRGDPHLCTPGPESVAMKVGQRLQHAPGLVVELPGRRDRPHAAQRLHEPSCDLALHRQVLLGDALRLAGEGPHEQHEHGNGGQEGNAEPGIDQRQRNRGPDRGNQVRDGADRDRGDATGLNGAADHAADEVANRESLGGAGSEREYVPRQERSGPCRGPSGHPAERQLVEGVGDHERGDKQGRPRQPACPRVIPERGVDRTPEHRGKGRLGDRDRERGDAQQANRGPAVYADGNQ